MSTFGPAYDADRDGQRVARQHERIRDWVLNRGWMTLGEIARCLRYPEASISAQLRHLRKERFGSYRVEKRRRTCGTWEYRVLPPEPPVLKQADLFDERPGAA